ncbi:glutathione peroxidase [Methylomonas koyamae]|uniref:Glutathione peroxidase n=1 Tax=Methylomonas koyamae TaxID=702114 RepID=A0A291IDJ6_9GAMM|nr:glutathione peroxidase [Methylomonas koyamae]ATG88365.1 glutathione peroxidase [Methylomonas koyamae]OAI21944.1 glutathione peroxidase [Methylomonas koyamae]
MKTLVFLLSICAAALPAFGAETCGDLLNFKMARLRSTEQIDFCQAFQGKLVLAVNTASNCGYTPQFKGLEALYQKYKNRGLAVIGFPSNDFNQEFDDAEQTAKVCYINYGVTFPMLEKSAVTGANANAFFRKLAKASGQEPQWNFHKYLIGRNGELISAFPSNATPEQLDAKIGELLSGH